MIVEGLSLARTQKEEFASILSSNNNDIKILINKLEEFINNWIGGPARMNYGTNTLWCTALITELQAQIRIFISQLLFSRNF